MCVAYRMWFTGGSGVAPHIKMSHFTLSNWETTLLKGIFRLRRIILGAVEATLDKIAVISLSTRLQRLHYSKMAHFATPALNVNFPRFTQAECCLVISVGDPSPPRQPGSPHPPSCLHVAVWVKWTGTSDPPVNVRWHKRHLCVFVAAQRNTWPLGGVPWTPGAVQGPLGSWKHFKWESLHFKAWNSGEGSVQGVRLRRLASVEDPSIQFIESNKKLHMLKHTRLNICVRCARIT